MDIIIILKNGRLLYEQQQQKEWRGEKLPPTLPLQLERKHKI